MSLRALAEAIRSGSFELVSTDLFDTVVLRDHTIESERLAIACRRAAPLMGVDAEALTRLRWSLQRDAYRSVAIERPAGEASLAELCAVAARAFGLDAQAGTLLQQAEVNVDIEHLYPNRPLLSVLDQAARSGLRVVALSDTYLGRDDLGRILDEVVGAHPISEIYSSADLGSSKHRGGAFAVVAEREQVAPERFLHVGDNYAVDVLMAEGAAWSAVHLRRARWSRVRATAGKARALPVKIRAMQ